MTGLEWPSKILFEKREYKLCTPAQSLPRGSRVYCFNIPPQNWDLLTTGLIQGGEVKQELHGAVSVRWDDGIWSTVRKENCFVQL